MISELDMRILVPIDGSDNSFRALRFAADLADRYPCTLHVVHITDVRGESTDHILERAREILDEEGIEDQPEVVTDVRLENIRYANRVGKDVLEIAREDDYDHIVMGHHGSGMVDRAILGSAAETIVRSGEVAVTVIP